MTIIPTIDRIDALASEYADKSPNEILALALSQQGEIAISFSGAEDIVLIDMASHLGKPFRVFSLDTGRLHAETYQFIERVRKHYNIEIEICFPETDAVQNLVTTKVYSVSLKMVIRNVAVYARFNRYVKNWRRWMAGLLVSAKTKVRVHAMKFLWFRQIQVSPVRENS